MERSSPLTKYGLFGWNYRYLLTHPWTIVEESYYRVKWFIQRGYKGYADCDVWSLDDYLLKWLPSALRELKETKHSYPCDLTPEQWDEALELMIGGLKAEKKWTDMEWDTEEQREALKSYGELGMTLFKERFHDLWD